MSIPVLFALRPSKSPDAEIVKLYAVTRVSINGMYSVWFNLPFLSASDNFSESMQSRSNISRSRLLSVVFATVSHNPLVFATLISTRFSSTSLKCSKLSVSKEATTVALRLWYCSNINPSTKLTNSSSFKNPSVLLSATFTTASQYSATFSSLPNFDTTATASDVRSHIQDMRILSPNNGIDWLANPAILMVFLPKRNQSYCSRNK